MKQRKTVSGVVSPPEPSINVEEWVKEIKSILPHIQKGAGLISEEPIVSDNGDHCFLLEKVDITNSSINCVKSRLSKKCTLEGRQFTLVEQGRNTSVDRMRSCIVVPKGCKLNKEIQTPILVFIMLLVFFGLCLSVYYLIKHWEPYDEPWKITFRKIFWR